MKKSAYYLSTLLSKLYDTKIAKPGKHEIVFIPGKTSNKVKSEQKISSFPYFELVADNK